MGINAFHSIVIFLYCIAGLMLGHLLSFNRNRSKEWLRSLLESFLNGFGTIVPATYLLSVFLSRWTPEPLFWSVFFVLIVTIPICGMRIASSMRKRAVRVPTHVQNAFLSIFFIAAFGISIWLMTKTLHGGSGGIVFVGSNTIFDMGHFLGLVRSVSWGNNIPISSPFFAGLPFFYHFFFSFWTALFEYFGIPLPISVTIPSALSFTALLTVAFYLPSLNGKTRRLEGCIAVLLTLTNASLAFWHIVYEKGISIKLWQYLWNLSEYPFRGPYDGSVISIFTTLNVYVNQRHLAFSSAYGWLLILLTLSLLGRKEVRPLHLFSIGIFLGTLFFWNMPVALAAGILIGLLFVIYRRPWKDYLLCFFSACLCVILFFYPYAGQWGGIRSFLQLFLRSGLPSYSGMRPQWNLFSYLWENLGILPLTALGGLFVAKKENKPVWIATAVLFILLCIWAGVGKRGFDQKYYSFLILGINGLSAVFISWMLRREWWLKGLAGITLVVLTASGAMNMFPIKNEFAYPLISAESSSLIAWIGEHTPKGAVFVSYSDIVDPVVLAGRKNYFGFFGNAGSVDRSAVVRQIYAGNIPLARSLGISYLLIPKWKKNDFPYEPDIVYFQEHRLVAYEDSRYLVVRLSD